MANFETIYGMIKDGQEQIVLGTIQLAKGGPGTTEKPKIELVNDTEDATVYLSGFNNYDFGCFCGLFEVLTEDNMYYFFFDNMTTNRFGGFMLLEPLDIDNEQPYKWYMKQVEQRLNQ